MGLSSGLHRAKTRTRRTAASYRSLIRFRKTQTLWLADLPTEILALILGQFCMHCRGMRYYTPQAFFPTPCEGKLPSRWYWENCQALRSACLVSRRLRDIAQPILHHQFCPEYGDPLGSLSCRDWYPRIAKFLRTVTAQPDLAAHVRHIHVATDLDDLRNPFQDASTQFNKRAVMRMESVVRALARLPNLACLTLTQLPWSPTALVPALEAAGVSSLPIQTLDIISMYQCSVAFAHAALELASSSLRTLNFHYHDALIKLKTLPRPLPNLRNLCLTGLMLQPNDDLALVLSQIRCTTLEDFTYEPRVAPQSYNHYLPRSAVSQLLKHSRTLTTLHLDLQLFRHIATPTTNPITTSLLQHLPTSFPALRHLFINTLILFDHTEPPSSAVDSTALTRLLPESIVTVRVVDDTTDPELTERIHTKLGSGLRGLAEAVLEGRFGKLRSVGCDVGEGFDGRGAGGVFVRAGVRFEKGSWGLSGGMPRRFAYKGPPP